MKMVTDIFLQIGLGLITVFMYLWMHNLPQQAFSKLLARRNHSANEAKRHFVKGAQLLAEAKSKSRSAIDNSAAASLAKSAADEADKAIAIDPKDAAAHILKALALDLQGFRTSALDSLDVALSPMAAKSLSAEERSDALIKRAELKVGMSQSERVDSAIVDLVESVKLKSDNAIAQCVLGSVMRRKGWWRKRGRLMRRLLGSSPGPMWLGKRSSD
ncbi:hypothetical protein LOK49_Contig274G00003 [Camellia lanceoleosa]|nr:hypothetical protein LOK49_Contig274G00003 [Camellia lanceoleosa]